MIGKSFGQYQIEELIGRGGMGLVYRAIDTKLDRTVAIKILPSTMMEASEERDRFLQEAKAASSFDHPNICTIFEINETDDGTMYIAMAYYPGRTLKEMIMRGPMNVTRVLDIATQIAAGLARAHKEGIIHRDVKPANIIVSDEGVVKIIDFGVAKLAQGTGMTKTGSTVGTVAYMSPEQAAGERVDHLTDIWSLGVIVFEMLAGKRPYHGEFEHSVIYSIINNDPVVLSKIAPQVPPRVEAVVMRALSRKRADRYQSMEAFGRDLKNMNGPDTADTVMAGTVPQKKKKARTSWIVSGALVAALTAVLILWPRGDDPAIDASESSEITPVVTQTSQPTTGAAALDTAMARPITNPVVTQAQPVETKSKPVENKPDPTAALEARRQLNAERTMANDANALLYAPDEFAVARSREQEAVSLFDRNDYVGSATLFEDAAQLYRRARDQALKHKAERVTELQTSQSNLAATKAQLPPAVGSSPSYANAVAMEAAATQSLDSPDLLASASAFRRATDAYQEVIDGRAHDNDAIKTLMDSYRAALESENVEAVASLHSNLSSKDRSDWKNFFEAISNLKVNMNQKSTTYTSAGAIIDVSVQLNFSGGDDAFHLWRMNLKRDDTGWIIEEISRNVQ